MPPTRSRAVLDAARRHLGLIVASAVSIGVLASTALFLFRAPSLEVQAPSPDARPDSLVTAPLPSSILSVPVSIDIATLARELEEALPRRWGSLEDRQDVPGRDRLSVAFELERGDLTSSFEDSLARVRMRVAYRVRAWYDPPVLPSVSGSCGTGEDELLPRLDVTLVSPLTLDADWRLVSRMRIENIAVVTDTDRDQCRITFARLDMTERVLEGARAAMEHFGPELDSVVSRVDLHDDFTEWWNILLEPVQLGESVWLVIEPEAVRRGPITGVDDRVETVVALRARARVAVGPRPTTQETPLPSLDTGVVEPGFRVRVEARAEYQEAGALLTQEIAGLSFEGGDRVVRVRRAELRGIGRGRLALGVDLTGAVRGRLWLIGTPAYDPEDGHVKVPDLAWDLASEAALVDGAAWLARAMLGTLRARARWPVSPAVVWAREQVAKGLNADLSDEVRLEGSVQDVVVVDVYAGVDALLVRADVTAQASLVIGQDGGTNSGPPSPPEGPGEAGSRLRPLPN